MKRLIISALSALTLTTLVAPAIASESIAFEQNLNRNVIANRDIIEITPFNLVLGGFQGRFINQGIPDGALFITKVKNKRIEAEDLVKAAIASNRLSEATLQDKSYLSHVDNLLEELSRK